MRGFGKRLGILALCTLMIGGAAITASAETVRDCPGGCTHQAAVNTSHYDTFAEAAAAAEAESTVTLLTDVTVSTPIILESPLCLDLGGKTLTASVAADQAAVTFAGGGSIRNGKLVCASGTALQIASCTVTLEKTAQLEGSGTEPVVFITADKDKEALVNLSAELSGEGDAPLIQVESQEGSCELLILKNARLTADTNPAVAFDSTGKLDISGGTIQTKKDILNIHIAEDRKTKLSVTGGKLLSEKGEAVVITADKKAKVPKDFVTGGTYRKVPGTYVPDYCKIRDNADGTYTVISSYKLTFLSGGAAGSMEAVRIRCGSSIKLPACGFTPADGMDFAGWEIGGKTYAAGDSFTPDSNVTATALWKAHVHSGGKATCLKKAVCTGCGHSYGKLGPHNLSAAGYAATCDKPGMNAHSKCSVCGGCFVDGVEISASSLSIPALGHNWETVEGKPATCTQDGLHTHNKCSTCGTLQMEGSPVQPEALVIPAAGHTLEQVEATKATCAEPGVQAHAHCTSCGSLFLAGQPVEEAQLTTALASHVLSDWVSDEHYHWKTCVDCDEVFRQNDHTDADADGSCDDCGYAMAKAPAEEADPESSGFSWLLLIPVVIAAAVAIPLAVKKYKK